MQHRWGITIFALTEILTGSITLACVTLSIIQGNAAKPLEVSIFVVTAAIISTALGLGILKHNLFSYHLLLYFASIIIFSKVLIFTKIIALSGALETAIPSNLKNTVSVLYHILLMLYFTRKPVREQFGK